MNKICYVMFSYWSCNLIGSSGNKPKKCDFVHQTVSCREVHRMGTRLIMTLGYKCFNRQRFKHQTPPPPHHPSNTPSLLVLTLPPWNAGLNIDNLHCITGQRLLQMFHQATCKWRPSLLRGKWVRLARCQTIQHTHIHTSYTSYWKSNSAWLCLVAAQNNRLLTYFWLLS